MAEGSGKEDHGDEFRTNLTNSLREEGDLVVVELTDMVVFYGEADSHVSEGLYVSVVSCMRARGSDKDRGGADGGTRE